MPPKLVYAIGDACWIAVGRENLAAGKVVGTFKLPHHPVQYYIIELTDSEWPHLEIRDALLMASEAGQPLAFWQTEASWSKTEANSDSH